MLMSMGKVFSRGKDCSAVKEEQFLESIRNFNMVCCFVVYFFIEIDKIKSLIDVL